jgi:8-hydroxy-5-deazaflavin:NADPH oxidoreductase
MKIGVLGTGMVGATIAKKLVTLGHEVVMGSRTADNERAVAWAGEAGPRATHGTFADAAAHGEIVFNCTLGARAVNAVNSAGAANLHGKILIDVSDPLDFSKGRPPTLLFAGGDSIGEQIQRALPDTKVVKALNTINCQVMVDPSRVPGDHDVFISGNDAGAKVRVAEILRDWFGWKSIVDLGDITTARGTECYLMLWVRLWGTLGTADFNIRIVR